MANAMKKAIIQKKIEGTIYDLMVRTRVDNILMEDGVTTLAEHLADIATGGVSEEYVDDAIQAAIDKLVNGAPEALDTLKEIADWIEGHEDQYEALVLGIGDIQQGVESLESRVEAHTGDSTIHVSADEKAKIAESARVLVGDTTPEDLSETDLFLQIVED